jgi:transmembrane sensor
MSAPGTLSPLDVDAFHWVVRLEQGRLGRAERRALMAWLQQGREQQRALIHARAFCNYVDELAGNRSPVRVPLVSRRRVLVAGAGGLALAGIAGIAWLRTGSLTDVERRYVTQVGGSRRLVLPDHSVLLLNTDTDVRVRYAQGRDVRMERGEALVTAAHGTGLFVVHVPGWVLTTLGAVFAVREDAGRVVVAVEEGELALLHTASGRAYRRLLPYFEAVLDPAGGIAVRAITGTELNDRLAWREGYVTFRHVALQDAVAEMNRYLARRIRVADPPVSRLTVLGTWPITRPEEFVSSLTAEFGLHAVQGDGEIVLTRADPASTDHLHP